MQHSEQINEIAAALAKAQAAMKPALKDALNPHFKAKYADLSAVWEACRKDLTTNGIAVVQATENEGENIAVTTMLAHTSGQWMRSTLAVKPVRNDPQGAGSAITYARRYSLAAMVGVVADEDDDGNEASGRKAPPRRDQPANQDAPKAPKPDAENPQRKKALEWARVVAGQIEIECGNVEAIDELMRQPAVVKGVAALRENHSDICDDLLERVNKRRVALSNQQAAE